MIFFFSKNFLDPDDSAKSLSPLFKVKLEVLCQITIVNYRNCFSRYDMCSKSL